MNLLDPALTSQLKGRLASFKKGLQKETREVLREAGLVLKAQIRTELLQHGRDAASPSKPGETPAAQTLELHNSIGMQWRATRSFFPRLRVGSGHPKARFLEFGTFKMRARPFMRRAFLAVQAQLARIAEARLGRQRAAR